METRRDPSTAFLGRQPIVSHDRTLIAYELLFRASADATQANVSDADLATARVLEGALAQDLAGLTGGVPGFINFNRHALSADFAALLQPVEAFVVEILESVPAEPEIFSQLGAMRERGVRFALDDVDSVDRLRRFIPYVSFAKIDWMAVDSATRAEIVKVARAADIPVIVERIETESEFAEARELGCEYFQGYLLGRPQTMRRTVVPTVDAHLLELMTALGDPASSPADLERLIAQDLGLTHRVLRFAASASAAQRGTGGNLHQATMLAGRGELHQIVALLLLSRMAVGSAPFAVTRALVRARFCADVARLLGDDAQQGFLAGMFSTLDELLGVPMAEALAPLSLDPVLHSGLIEGDGRIGESLRLVTAVEQASWVAAGDAIGHLGLPDDLIPQVYSSSVREADRIAAAA